MDIYAFLNSQDIAEHCKKLRHHFTAREMAYIIWSSNHHTLDQKMLAWAEIINALPDEEHKDFEYVDGHGLHHFLRKYMNQLVKALSAFQRRTENCVYSYTKLYTNTPEQYLDESPLFTSYDICIASAVIEAADTDNILSFRVCKRKLHEKIAMLEDCSYLVLGPQAEPMELIMPEDITRDMPICSPPFGFYGMWIDVPTPFEKGDVVCVTDRWGYRSGPYVICELPSQGIDYIDMNASVQEPDPHSYEHSSQDVPYLSLEYFGR